MIIDYWEINKGCLNDLADKLEEVEPYPSHKTMVMGGWAYRQIRESKDAWAYYVQGFGSHIKRLLKRIPEASVIIVAEKDLRHLRTCLEYESYREVIESKRVFILTEKDRFTVAKVLSALQDIPNRDLQVCTPMDTRDGQWHVSCLEAVLDYCDMQRTGLVTQFANSQTVCQNIIDNLKHHRHGLEGLQDYYKGRPAVLIAAGPSLDKHMALLADPKYRYVSICVPTVLKALMLDGISPHFVTALDYHGKSGQFFDDLPGGRLPQAVFEPKFASAGVSAYAHYNPIIRFLGSDFAALLLRESYGQWLGLDSGSTVAHLSFYLARLLGCNPIIHVGQDLSFTPGKYYPKCVLESHPWKEAASKPLTDPETALLRRCKDDNGDLVYQDEQMHSYLDQFEHIWKRATENGTEVIDCTGAGVKKSEAVIRMDFRECLDKYATGPVIPLPPLPEDKERSGWQDSLSLRRGQLRGLIDLVDDLKGLFTSVDMEDKAGIDKHRGRAAEIRGQWSGNYKEITHLVELYCGRSMLERTRADQDMGDLEGYEKSKAQLVRDIKFQGRILQGAEILMGELGEVEL